VHIGAIRGIFAMPLKRENRGVALSAKDADQFTFVLIGNRMSQNEKMKFSVLATFDRVSEAER
jgi:hypothetical protein